MNGNGFPPGAQANPCRVTKKTSRSYRSSILHTFLRGFGTNLIKPGKPTPAGSPELRADEEAYRRCNVRQRIVEGIRLYDLNARSNTTAESFIPAYLYSLTLESEPFKPNDRTETEILNQVKYHDEQHIVSHDFASRQKGGKKRKQIYYFAGGAWQSTPSPDHWKFCAHLVHRLTARGFPTTVTIVSYPLAPNNPFSTSFPMLEKLYNELLPPYEEHEVPSSHKQPDPTTKTPASTSTNGFDHTTDPTKRPPQPNDSAQIPKPQVPVAESTASLRRYRTTRILPNEEIIFAGDSAGANVALSLTLHMLQNPLARAPDSLLLISPAVDLRHVNPDMDAVAKNDPILTRKYINAAASAWLGGNTPAEDPRVSPLLSPHIPELAKRNIAVHGVLGGYDMLAPDGVLFRKKCEELRIRGEWLEWDKQMHCFPLAFSYKVLPDSMEACEWVLDVLQGRGLSKKEKIEEESVDVSWGAVLTH